MNADQAKEQRLVDDLLALVRDRTTTADRQRMGKTLIVAADQARLGGEEMFASALSLGGACISVIDNQLTESAKAGAQ